MVHGNRVDEAVARLLARIRAGEFTDEPLPREADLAQESGVSRATLREAVKVLKTQGVLRVEQGRGTYVNPITEWESLDLLATPGPHANREELSVQLIQARRMIEVGAAELFAGVCTDDDLERMRQHLEGMSRADAAGDVGAFVHHDLAFHDVILQGCGNVFVPLLMRPVSRHLAKARYETSAVPQVRTNALGQHAAILAALRTGDPDASASAMLGHLRQTDDDLHREILQRTPA
ncbi:MAG: FadR family transcriptional regulator [Austwickia sp.]|jgi:GntR family transcriptional repressor for pyruvate dehydrogenase complex|nr:FadR family transcriptional regulator [Austwickia sp.]MBK8437435.1 FadR family transcriptional regulator [Austwickia sp.]MBK9102702.1 FadR family transcriptional regulator [Austwickia sp.]